MLYWNDIVGHPRVRNVLSRAFDTGRLHHGYLFVGPAGVGKFSLAMALAATLNCEQRPEGHFQPSCGSCSSCKRAASRQHPDLHLIAPTGNQIRTIKISVIRELQKVCVSQPYEKGYRVIVIDQAHYMSEEAANALLKTLEEPPERTILILVTDQPQRLLDTILSRCQLLRFGTLEPEQVSRALQKIYAATAPFDRPTSNPLVESFEDPYETVTPTWESPDDTLFSVAAGYGEGSLGRALDMLQTGMLAQRRELLTKLLTMDSRSQIAWLDTANDLSNTVAGLQDKLDLLTVFFRDLMFFKQSGTQRLVNRDLADLMESSAPDYSTDKILDILENLMEARMRLQGSISSQLLAENIVYRIRPT